MSRKGIMNIMKKMMTGFMAVAMILTGIVVTPNTADAATEYNEVVFSFGEWAGDVPIFKAEIVEGPDATKDFGTVYGDWATNFQFDNDVADGAVYTHAPCSVASGLYVNGFDSANMTSYEIPAGSIGTPIEEGKTPIKVVKTIRMKKENDEWTTEVIESTELTVTHEQLDISKYWFADESKRTVPVKEDYVFGGWYTSTDGSNFTALKEADLVNQNLDDIKNITYAKFVPAYVLSVKMQIEAAASENDGATTDLRVLSSVDSLDYQETGFEIWLGSRTQAEATPVITKVYGSLKLNADDTNPKTPEKEFGAASDYFSVLRIKNIKDSSDKSNVYARPYWVTLDGTVVEGMAKYLRVEDAFEGNEYISIPVNLLTGEEVAAGIVTMTYDAYKVKVVDVQGGRLLTEMDNNTATAGTIQFVCNATIDSEGTFEQVNADGLYANVRFQLQDGVTLRDGEHLEFTMSNEDFSNWNEEDVSTVKAWNVYY